MPEKRTDIHKPSSIIPEDYVYVAMGYQKFEGLGSIEAILAERAILNQHMERTGGTWSKHQHGGNCHICGAGCIYTVIFYHEKSNSYIKTGMDCATKLEMGDKKIFKTFRNNIQEAMKNRAGKAKAEGILGDEGLTGVWNIFKEVDEQVQKSGIEWDAREHKNVPAPYLELKWEEKTIHDIVGKLVKYGRLSEKQIAFLHKLWDKINDRPNAEARRKAKQEQWAKEKEAAESCPKGRVEVTGTVVKIDVKYNDFGERHVMTVKEDRGFMLWGTIPSSIMEVEKGDKVKFTGTLEPSDKDEKFGFFKRPSKAEVTERKIEEQEGA